MPRIGIPELIVILVIALVVFGPGKLPTVGKSIGEAINEFKKASTEITKGSTTEGNATVAKAEEKVEEKVEEKKAE